MQIYKLLKHKARVYTSSLWTTFVKLHVSTLFCKAIVCECARLPIRIHYQHDQQTNTILKHNTERTCECFRSKQWINLVDSLSAMIVGLNQAASPPSLSLPASCSSVSNIGLNSNDCAAVWFWFDGLCGVSSDTTSFCVQEETRELTIIHITPFCYSISALI